jgi:CDP-glycerol glycerophosphotransferase
MFDYSVTGKPIVFYVAVLDAYVASRGSYFDLGEYAPGALCTELDQIVEHLADLPLYQQVFAERYEEFRLKFTPWDDGRAAQRVVEAFFN